MHVFYFQPFSLHPTCMFIITKTPFHHCTFSFIIAHFVLHCTLEHALSWNDVIQISFLKTVRRSVGLSTHCYLIVEGTGERKMNHTAMFRDAIDELK